MHAVTADALKGYAVTFSPCGDSILKGKIQKLSLSLLHYVLLL